MNEKNKVVLAAFWQKINWGKVWNLCKMFIVYGVGKLMVACPLGVFGFSWEFILSVLAFLGLVDAARYPIPDKYIFVKKLRTGDGMAGEENPKLENRDPKEEPSLTPP